MRALPGHGRRWASDNVPSARLSSAGSSPGISSPADAEELVEVILDFHPDDTIVLRSVEPASAQLELPISGSSTPSMGQSPSNRIRQFSQELKAEARRLSHDFMAELKKLSRSQGHAGTSASPGTGFDSALAARAMRRQRAELDRSRSGAQKALRGLRFISTRTNSVDAWNEVLASFDKLSCDGHLSRSDFALCIGMKDSKEFALELFDALSRRRRLKTEKISKDELYEFWLQITDQSFDSRLQIFFDMVDKDADGRITEAQVKEILMLSASANKLSRLKEQAEEYAALIMEELDPERLGYIEVLL